MQSFVSSPMKVSLIPAQTMEKLRHITNKWKIEAKILSLLLMKAKEKTKLMVDISAINSTYTQ